MVNVYFCVVDAHTLKILAALRQQRNHNIKLWFDSCYSSNKVVSSIKDKRFVRHGAIDNGLNCYRWDVAAENVSRLYDADNEQRHLVSRYVSDGTDFICVDNVGHANNQLVFFQDAIHLSDYPQKFVKFPCYSTVEELFECLSTTKAFQFSLEDGQRFIKCSGIKPVQGAAVYREMSTGNYWYLDMLHKTHYEVFDSTGKKHLGEADLNGVLDGEKAEKGRTLNVK